MVNQLLCYQGAYRSRFLADMPAFWALGQLRQLTGCVEGRDPRIKLGPATPRGGRFQSARQREEQN